MSTLVYSAAYFIAKFEAIPPERFLLGTFWHEPTKSGCALGHCGARVSVDTEESEALVALFGGFSETVAINNGASCGSDYATGHDKTGMVKLRLLAALRGRK